MTSAEYASKPHHRVQTLFCSNIFQTHMSGRMIMELPKLYEPKEVANSLRVTVNWLEEMAAKKQIPHCRCGRRLLFTVAQVEQIIRQSEVSPPSAAPVRPAHTRPTAMQHAADPTSSDGRRLKARTPRRLALLAERSK